MTVAEDITILVVLVTIFLIYYTKAKKQTLKETMDDLREAFIGVEEEDE